MNVLVIGGGAWGTAIANVVAHNQHDVLLWSRNHGVVESINNQYSNHIYCPNITLSHNIKATNNLKTLENIDSIFIVIPSNIMRETVIKLKQLNIPSTTKIFICSKGIEQNSLLLMSEIIQEYLPNNYAVLSGPNFASEVLQQKCTFSVCAAPNKIIFQHAQTLLNNEYFSIIYSAQIARVQISASLKNVIAIACGIIEGANLGHNLKAAIVSCGYSEIESLLKHKKIPNSNVDAIDLSGIGDLVLTCYGTMSRNMQYGYNIGKYGVKNEKTKYLVKG